MIKPNTEPFAKFKVGDKIRGRDALGIVDGQPGIVRAVHTSYPTADDYEDLTNPGISPFIANSLNLFLPRPNFL